MLSHFSVKNYKCLADVSLPLTPIHVLIGKNDTGKSSLFEAMRSSFATISRFDKDWKNFRDAFPGEWSGRELIWHQSAEPVFEATLQVDARTSPKLRVNDLRLSWRFGDQDRPLRIAPDQKVDVGVNGVWLNGEDMTSRSPDDFRENLIAVQTAWRTVGMAHSFRLQPKVMSRPSGLTRPPKYVLEEDGFGLPALLDEIKDYDVDRYVELQSIFRQYFPQYQRVRLETALAWARNMQDDQVVDHRGAAVGKQVWLATERGDVRLQQASDGAIILLGFLALMFSPTPPGLFLIEEPENGIHPKRLIEVARLLRQFVEREENAPQIIMTTHSPYLLSQFQPEEVTLMRRQPDGSAKAFPLRDAPHIRERMGDDFYLGELWYNLDEEELLK
jgi:predicted ATPase